MGLAALIAIDSSAVVAIIMAEPEASIFDTLISERNGVMTTANAMEVHLALSKYRKADYARRWLQEAGISLYPVDLNLLTLARDAHDRFGRGNHPARLNFGDCFSYALAKATGYPLLFKGDDFGRTDVEVAIT